LLVVKSKSDDADLEVSEGRKQGIRSYSTYRIYETK